MAEPSSDGWYIVLQESGHCDIVSASENRLSDVVSLDSSPNVEDAQRWGPFDSQGEAIARRVGLIRAGRCKPV